MIRKHPRRWSRLGVAMLLSASSSCIAGPVAANGELTRLATLPGGAEVTGLFLSDGGDLFFNAQHPSGSNPAPFDRATVGVIADYDFRELPVDFEPLPLPGGKGRNRVNVAVGRYRVLARAGDVFDGEAPLGLITTAKGKPIKQSNNPDFNGFVPTDATGSEGFLFTAWEDRPGGMSRLHLRKDTDGNWQEKGGQAVDFSAVDGTWVNCFGTVSPWDTPLTSEELYFDHTAQWNQPGSVARKLVDYLGGRFPNPYQYGYIVEITEPGGVPTPVKRPALGRFSHENAVVMPDHRTVYLSDDGKNSVFFRFVADRGGDLSAGTLYAAHAIQDRGSDPGHTGFTLRWLKLGHADEAEIKRWIAEYDGIGPADYHPGSTGYIPEAAIAAWAEDMADNGRLDSVQDARAAFLESRRAARALGATAEWNKMEGVNIHYGGAADGSVPYLYLAISRIDNGMSDGSGDVRLEANPCGIVYRLRLEEEYRVSRMEPAVTGGPYSLLTFGDRCPADNIAGPDNLAVLPDGRVLIGEDTAYHANNMLWVWRPPEGNPAGLVEP